MLRLILATSLSGILLVPPCFAYTADELLAWHNQEVAQANRAMQSDCASGKAYTYYFTSIHLMGMLSAIEACLQSNPTQADQLMQKIFGYIDQMISKAKSTTTLDARGVSRVHKAWDPYDTGSGTELYTYQGAEPIARAAALIVRTPAFSQKYLAKATSYAQFVNDAVIQRWYVDRYNSQIPWIRPGDWPVWSDKAWLIGDILNSLYQATGKDQYLTMAQAIATSFRSRLKASGPGWIFDENKIPIGSDTNDEPGSVGNQTGSPDTAHANRLPMMMIFMHEAGIVYSRADVDRLAATLGQTLWNGSSTSPLIANYITGSNKPYRTRMNPGSNGFIFSGWALLGRYSTQAQAAIDAILAGMKRNASNATLDANDDSYYKRVAITGHALRNVVFSSVPSNPLPPPNGPFVSDTPAPSVVLNLPTQLSVRGVLRADVSWANEIRWSISSRLANGTTGASAAPKAPVSLSASTTAGTWDLAAYHLDPGAYHVEAVAISARGETSEPAGADIYLVSADLNNVRVYPNPWDARLGLPREVTFNNLNADAEVRIFTISGHWVRTLHAEDNKVVWDMQNDNHEYVSSGLYFYLIQSSDGQKVRGKIAIIH